MLEWMVIKKTALAENPIEDKKEWGVENPMENKMEEITSKFMMLANQLWVKPETIKLIEKDLADKKAEDTMKAQPIKTEQPEKCVEVKKEVVVAPQTMWIHTSPMEVVLAQKTAY